MNWTCTGANKFMPRVLLIISIFVFVGLACKNGANLTANNTNTESNNIRAENTLENTRPDNTSGQAASGEGVKTGDSRTIAGGLLNDKAVDLPKPSYPPIARAVKAAGKVVVNIEVAPDGSVVKAEAESGHPLLKAAAVAAARLAKFKPGPSPISGSLEYEFNAP
jgi:TonB family protein